MAMDVNYTYCDKHFTIYTNAKMLCCTPETSLNKKKRERQVGLGGQVIAREIGLVRRQAGNRSSGNQESGPGRWVKAEMGTPDVRNEGKDREGNRLGNQKSDLDKKKCRRSWVVKGRWCSSPSIPRALGTADSAPGQAARPGESRLIPDSAWPRPSATEACLICETGSRLSEGGASCLFSRRLPHSWEGMISVHKKCTKRRVNQFLSQFWAKPLVI